MIEDMHVDLGLVRVAYAIDLRGLQLAHTHLQANMWVSSLDSSAVRSCDAA